MRRLFKMPVPKMGLSTVKSSNTYDDDVRRTKEDNDPQTIFYLKFVSVDPALHRALGDASRDVLPTLYFWATKIERTVQEKIGNKNDPERGTAQASWDRAAYRVELLDHLARDTPWMMGTRDNKAAASKQELTGEYHHDKLAYQKTIHQFIKDNVPNALARDLRVIERYIVETMVLSQGELSNVRRFALAFPSMNNTGPFVLSGLCLVSFAINKEVDDHGRAWVAISLTSFEARINKEIFDAMDLEPELLRAGEALVLDAMAVVVVNS
ncbi:hypothetical protein F4779DRAFT_608396 [Xylariaceae sp. FL0662B]|nr:hypothetical protein F4779DRAFT_608396 [Xylariaceae sp. FL0662B]